MGQPLRADTRPVLNQLARENNPAAMWGEIKTFDALPGRAVWRCVWAQRLAEADNQGNHNVYVDCLDELGKRIDKPGWAVLYGWSGSVGVFFTPFEKPAFEPGANFSLSSGMDAWCTIEGNQSDTVLGLRGEFGHTSYYIVFQRQTVGAVQPPQPQPPNTVIVSMDALLKAERLSRELQAAIDALR